MKIQLSDHFTYGRLFRFTLPSIVMMVFTSIYGVVDGFFVSNFAGKTAFASINLIMPFYHYHWKPWLHGRNRWHGSCLPHSR